MSRQKRGKGSSDDARASRLTVILAPTTEFLVEIERSGAVPHLDVRQPLRDYVQEGSVHPDSSTDNCDYNPPLCGLVCGI